MRISFLSRITCTILILVGTVISFLCVIKDNLKNTYVDIALIQTKSTVTKIINQVVRDKVKDNKLELDYSKEQYVTYDVGEINQMVSNLSTEVVEVLEDINHSDYSFLVDEDISKKYNCTGIVYELEMGKLLDTIFFNSLGSKYPVKFKLASDVLSSTDLSIEEFGLNNALISLNLIFSFNFSLILPLTSKLEQVDIKVPLSMLLVEGDVPSFIYGNHNVEGVNSFITEVKKI